MKLDGTVTNIKVFILSQSIEVLRNLKFQAPNSNEISNINIQWPKQVEFWILVIVICLLFVICDLEF